MTPDEQKLIAELGFDASVVAILRSAWPEAMIERLNGYDADFNEIPVAGIAVATPTADRQVLLATVDEIADMLADLGYTAFLTERDTLSDTKRESLHDYLIAAIRVDDKLAPLRIRRTEAYNFELENADIVAKFDAWDKAYGASILGADYDWVTVKLDRLPKELKSFAGEVFDFCPDVVKQGTGPAYDAMDDRTLADAGYTLEAGMETEEGGLAMLAQDIARTKVLSLWWD